MKRLLVLACLLAGGCSIQTADWTASLLQLSPGDEVQTATYANTGLQIAPLGNTGPNISIGRQEIKLVRVPGFDTSTVVPDVTVSSGLDADSGAVLSEGLEVGTRQRQ